MTLSGALLTLPGDSNGLDTDNLYILVRYSMIPVDLIRYSIIPEAEIHLGSKKNVQKYIIILPSQL